MYDEEYHYGAGLRYASDVRFASSRFTGKERDNESGNDYFKYRYYASSMGRWLSPDPSGLSHADLGNPQSLNLYNYVGNRPLTIADLDGLCWKGFQWACDLGNAIKNLAIDAKNKIAYGEWTTNTTQAKIHSVDRHEARTRSNSYRKETQPERYEHDLIDLPQLDPNGPPVPRLTVRAAPTPKKPEPPGWYECLTVPGDATAAYRDSMAAYNNARPSSAPSDNDTSANGVGGGATFVNLNGNGWSAVGSADAATKVNAAAAIADYGVSAVGCGLTK